MVNMVYFNECSVESRPKFFIEISWGGGGGGGGRGYAWNINLPASSEYGNNQNSTLNNATRIIVQCLIQPVMSLSVVTVQAMDWTWAVDFSSRYSQGCSKLLRTDTFWNATFSCVIYCNYFFVSRFRSFVWMRSFTTKRHLCHLEIIKPFLFCKTNFNFSKCICWVKIWSFLYMIKHSSKNAF